MSHYTHRALRAAVAAAGMAGSYVTCRHRRAASPNTDESTTGTTRWTTSLPRLLADRRRRQRHARISNELLTFEVPKVETASYRTAWNRPVSHHHEDADDENNDDEDNVCHGTNGSWDLPFHNAYQHPCQSHGNSFQEGPVQYFGVPAANRVTPTALRTRCTATTRARATSTRRRPATAASLLGLAKSRLRAAG